MPNSPRTPAECFATILLWLSRTVDGHSMWGRLPRPLGLLILDRIRAINQRFARLAARIGAGTFRARRSPVRRPHAGPKSHGPNPLPQDFAWLVKLVPETAAYGSQLQFLFATSEMAALLEAAPAAMRRPLRSLCRMLGVLPPPILASPKPTEKHPSPAKREREGPVAERREGEGFSPTEGPAPLSPNIPGACGPPLLPA